MAEPEISVVMSVYNGARTLPRAVESLLAQTFADFELVIVNDGSRDETAGVLAKLAARDARIRVIEQPNTGLTVALRNGCAQSRGEFIARQDADDWSHPRRFEKSLAAFAAHPQAVMVSSWTRYVEPFGETVDDVRRPEDPQRATQALLHERQGPPAHGSVMFRRSDYEAVGGYREEFYYGQDSDLWLRLGVRGPIVYVPEHLYEAAVSPAGISGAYGDMQWRFGELGQQAHAARLTGQSEAPILKEAAALRRERIEGARRGPAASTTRACAAAHYRIGASLSRRGSGRARHYFWQTVRLDPWHWRGWLRLCRELVRRTASPGAGAPDRGVGQ